MVINYNIELFIEYYYYRYYMQKSYTIVYKYYGYIYNQWLLITENKIQI